MKLSRSLLALGSAVGLGAVLAGSGAAVAATPNFSDCPRSQIEFGSCVSVQTVGGSLTIKGFRVPIGESFQVRGGVTADANNNTIFIPPRGTTGVFSKPIQVPGGLLGINFPLPGNAVTATAQLAGRSSDVKFDLGTLGLALPLKLKLTNPLLGPNCYIGTDSNPVRVNLETTQFGNFESPPDGSYGVFRGQVNEDNRFSIPAATPCGYIGTGLIGALVNAKLRLPSTSGNNQMVTVADVGLQVP